MHELPGNCVADGDSACYRGCGFVGSCQAKLAFVAGFRMGRGGGLCHGRGRRGHASSAAGTLTPNVAVDNTLASLQAPKSDIKIVSKPAASRRRISTANSADGNGAGPFEIADARPVSPFADVVPGRAKEAFAESQGAQAEPAIGDDALFVENFIPRWTLSSDGTLQRSLDSGRTWQTIGVSSQTIFRVLAANGMDIWVGGAAGALFHSSDAGQHWTQVRPVVNGEALADDIIGVEFTDAVHGKLTSSVQEIWITADAGQTWQKQ